MRPAQDEQIRQHVDDVDLVQLPLYPNHQTLPRVLVDRVQHPEGTAVLDALIDEVIRSRDPASLV